MMNHLLVVIFCITLVECRITKNKLNEVRKFPDGFIFGTATASYQIEGAWNQDGKSEDIWDHISHYNPCKTLNCSTGDVADNSYYLYKRDVQMLRELGVDFYRISLSWTRILPTSFPDKINKRGIAYYNNLINELLKYNITPMVTIYHWDLPQKLQELGGWTNPHIVNWYVDFARVAFENFGDRVKYWFTINEPREICYQGYGANTKAPMVNISGYAEYLCAKNVLIAHASAYHVYDREFRSSQCGVLGIAYSAQWYEPATKNDVVAAEEANQFEWAQYVHPIFSEIGDFPPIMKARIEVKSKAQGFHRSRLPKLTPDEVQFVRGTSDFFGLNHYVTYLVYRNDTVHGHYDTPSYYDDLEVILYQPPDWKTTTKKIKSSPWGFYKLLTKIREDYGNPRILISENGYSTFGGLVDDDRVSYHRSYLSAMLDAIDEGSDIIGYTIWSLMDNFEWTEGYTERFGLYEVDYNSTELTRTPRKSAFVYKEMVRTRSLDSNYEPNTTVMTISEGH